MISVRKYLGFAFCVAAGVSGTGAEFLGGDVDEYHDYLRDFKDAGESKEPTSVQGLPRRVETTLVTFEELKAELERCGCECYSDNVIVDLSDVTIMNISDIVTIPSSCGNATVLGALNDSVPTELWPRLNILGGKLFTEGSTASNTSLTVRKLQFTMASSSRPAIVNYNADLYVSHCIFATNGVSAAIEALGTGRTNVKVEASVFGPPEDASFACPNFKLASPVESVKVERSTFMSVVDLDSCFDGVPITASDNVLVLPSFSAMARTIETFPTTLPKLLDNGGLLQYEQYDAYEESPTRSVNVVPDVSIAVELDLSYGDLQNLVITTQSNAKTSLKGNNNVEVPDLVQISSIGSPACIKAIRMKQGNDVVVNVRASIMEFCLSVCSLTESQTSCGAKLFTFDPVQECLLVSQGRSKDLTIDLGGYGCTRLIPAPGFSYAVRVESPNTYVGDLKALVDESPFLESGYTLSFSGSPLTATAIGNPLPETLKIIADEFGDDICISKVVVEYDDNKIFADLSLETISNCIQGLCGMIYNAEKRCLNLSTMIGGYKAIIINFSREGCDRFRFVKAGGVDATSICHTTVAANSVGQIQDALQMLSDNVYSSLRLDVSDLLTSNEALPTIELQSKRSLEMIYVGTSSGNRKLVSGSSRLFRVQQGASMTLSGFIVQDGGIDNDGGTVKVVDVTFLNAYSGLDDVTDGELANNFLGVDGGTILNRNNGLLEVYVSSFSGSRSAGNGGSIATVGASTSTILLSYFQNSSATGKGQVLFNCGNCTTRIDSSIFDGDRILFNEVGGEIFVEGRIRLVRPTSLLETGSNGNITFEDVSRMTQIVPGNDWCDHDLATSLILDSATTLDACGEYCLSNSSCEAIAFDKSVPQCSICYERPCRFNCTNTTLFYGPKTLYKFAVVDLDKDGVCLVNAQEIAATIDLPIAADSVRNCQEACGYFDDCKFARFREDTVRPCRLYSMVTFAETDDMESICEGSVYFKYRNALSRPYIPVAAKGCFHNTSLSLASVTVGLNDIRQKCEAVCISNPLCRGFMTNGNTCTIYDDIWFDGDNCTIGGEIFIDARSESFPKKDFVSITTDVLTREGTVKSTIRSAKSCQRLCDRIPGCNAIVFDELQLVCTTFTREQLSGALVGGGEEQDIFVRVRRTEVIQLEDTSTSGCPVLDDFSRLQQTRFAGFLSEQVCTTVCYYSGSCDFFLFDLVSQACQFFRSESNPSCTNPQGVPWLEDSTRAWSLRRGVETVEDFYEAKQKCTLQKSIRTFGFDVSPLNLLNVGYETELVCKELCTSYQECIGITSSHSLNGELTSCTMLTRLVIVGEPINGTCQVGDLFNTIEISLDKVNNLDTFLPAPAEACPLSRSVNFVTRETCFNPDCKSSKLSKSKSSKLPKSSTSPKGRRRSEFKIEYKIGKQTKASKAESCDSSSPIPFDPFEPQNPISNGTHMPKNITENIVAFMMGDRRECEKLCLDASNCEAYSWEDPNCTLEEHRYFDDCSNLDLNDFQIIYYRPDFNDFQESPRVNSSEAALENAKEIDDNFSCEALCKVFSDCGAVIYDNSLRECVLLRTCNSAAANGLNPLNCSKVEYSYKFFKIEGFCLEGDKVPCKKINDVFRVDHCMAYCDGWFGCSTLVYNSTTLTCDLYKSNLGSSPVLIENLDGGPCFGGGDLYLSSEYSPRFPYRATPNNATVGLCPSIPPKISNITNSPAACFKSFCEPTSGCLAFAYDFKSGSCDLYSSSLLTVSNCTSLNTTKVFYVVTEFDAPAFANTSAANILVADRSIVADSDIECGVVCDAFPSCDAYVYSFDTNKCQLAMNDTAFESNGSFLIPLGMDTQFIELEFGRRLLQENEILSFKSAEWFCLWICYITVECKALEFNDQVQECGLFESSDYTTDPFPTNTTAIWIPNPATPDSGPDSSPGGGLVINSVTGLAGKPDVKSRGALDRLNAQIDELERTARPLVGDLERVGGTVSSLVEALQTAILPIISLNEDIDIILKIVRPINIAFDLMKKVVKPLRVLLQVTKLDTALEKVQATLSKAQRVVDRAGDGATTAVAPFEVVEIAALTISDVLDMLVPPAFLRDLSRFLRSLLLCVEEVDNVELRFSIGSAIETLTVGVIELKSIVATLDNLSNDLLDVINEMKTKLQDTFVTPLSNFAGILASVKELFNDEPWKSLNGLIDLTILVIPTFEIGTGKLDLGFLGSINFPKLSIAGELCLPFPKIICDAIRTIDIFGIARKIVSGALNFFLSTFGVGPRIDFDDCYACIVFSDAPSKQISIRDLIDLVNEIVTFINDNVPFLKFLLDAFDLVIEKALEVTGISKLFPEFPLSFPDLLELDEIVKFDVVNETLHRMTEQVTILIKQPNKLMQDFFQPLDTLLDSLPCNVSDKLKDFVFGDASGSAESNSTRSLQAREGTYSEFDSVTRFSDAVFGTLIQRFQSITGKSRDRVTQPPKNKQLTEEQKALSRPQAFAPNMDWLVDPRYLLADNPESSDNVEEKYNRVAYGAAVFVYPSPERARKRLREEFKDYYLLSYLTYDTDNIVNGNVCVNKIADDGRIEDDFFGGRRIFSTGELLQMTKSGFASDFAYEVRIDFGVSDWTSKQFVVADNASRKKIGKLVLEVVENPGITVQRNCVGCKRGAGCFKHTNTRNLQFQGTRTEFQVGDPKNTRSYLALYSGPFSRSIFYDPSTFGFFLTQGRFGVGTNANPNYKGCAIPDGGTGGPTYFRRWLQGELRIMEPTLPDAIVRSVGCENSFVIKPNGRVVNDKTNQVVGGTFWVSDNDPGTTDRRLFGCQNDDEFRTSQNDKASSSDVEHIVEESTLRQQQNNPLVDFVMSWALWNQENGILFNQDLTREAALKEKRALYGDDVYNCVKSLLGGIIENNPGQLVATDSCQMEVWMDTVCQSALRDVKARRTFDLL